jgi:hypothetical protein
MIWLPISPATQTLLTLIFLFALTATSATSAKTGLLGGELKDRTRRLERTVSYPPSDLT